MDDVQREMPRYVEQVWALKIKAIQFDRLAIEGEPRGAATITPEDEGYAPFRVDERWAIKNRPQVGGYYVVHRGGTATFEPAFEFDRRFSVA